MSEEHLSALLAKLKEDTLLRKKLKEAKDLKSAAFLAREAGFDVTIAEWLEYHSTQHIELSDAELEGVAGGAEKEPCIKDDATYVCTIW